MADGLSELYQDLLTGSYDCVDRIVLNGYFRRGHSPGGFRVWWRALTGSEDTLDNTHLMRLAGRFSRRIRGYAKAHNIPLLDCRVGERRHDIAEEYLAKTQIRQGLFLILIGRLDEPRRPYGTSADPTIFSAKSLCPTSTTTHFTFSIPSGATSLSRSVGILRSPPK